MSEDSKVQETAEAVADESVADAPLKTKSEDAPAPKTTKRTESKRETSSVSWLALFLSLATLAAVGYMIVEDQRTRDAAASSSDSIAQLSGRIDESRRSLSELDQGLADLASSDESIQSHVESLQQGIEERIRLMDSLPGRMSNLENSIASLQGISAGARDTWLLAEAEYYMQIANAQLQLGNNPHLAMLALGMADERVVQMANPGLTDVHCVRSSRPCLKMTKPWIPS
jgi:uroporphyrin-3 C-methyltransferase